MTKGCIQSYESDYYGTFSLVAKINFGRFFLAMVSICHWPLHHPDFENAFLHGDLEKETYIEQPLGFVAQRSLV